MYLYTYLSLQSFVEGCNVSGGENALVLQAENLLHAVPSKEYQYGLSLLRKAIRLYEEQKGISLEKSKQDIPFFREKRRLLIGPELDIYKLSFYADEHVITSQLQLVEHPYLKLAFDYEQLAEHCLFENMFLIRCKYDEEEVVKNFVSQMDREYDKFFYDEEHSGFTADSHFFSLLYNACLEVKEPRFAGEQEWRLAVLRSPSEVDYRYADGKLTASLPLSLPLASIRRVTFPDHESDELNYSALAGFMQHIGLFPEHYLEGLLEE